MVAEEAASYGSVKLTSYPKIELELPSQNMLLNNCM
jgi:hypothetical protein